MEVLIKKDQKNDCLNIRNKVFVHEQGFDQDEEIDSFDETCHYLTAYYQNQCVGCLRYYQTENPTVALVGRVAVLKEFRNKKIGKKLMLALEDILIQDNYREITLHAQITALPFYKALGYVSYGEIALDGTKNRMVEHIWLKKPIAK